MNSIDLTFNLSWKAEVLLKMLGRYFECHPLDSHSASHIAVEDLDNLDIRAYPLYNGRERGACLVVNVGHIQPRLLLFFAEHRSCESLFVQWDEVNEVFINAPTIGDFSDESHNTQRELFGGDNFSEAASFVCNKIGEFHKKQMGKAA